MRISDWSSDVCSSDLISMSILTADRAAFREALPHGGRLIGLDVGTKTIGIALCDAGWSIASPAHTVSRGKFSKDKIALAAFMEQQQVKGVVIGLPLNLDEIGRVNGGTPVTHAHLVCR